MSTSFGLPYTYLKEGNNTKKILLLTAKTITTQIKTNKHAMLYCLQL